MSFFESINQVYDDPILQLPIACAADPRKQKVNLGIGIYQNSEGIPFVLNSVKKNETTLLSKEQSKTYLPIEGDPLFLKAAAELVFGKSFLASLNGGLFAAQALGGTGALRLGGEFLSQETSKTIFIPSPTWPNHKPVFNRSGMKVHSYGYYDQINHRLDFSAMCSDISNMPPGSTLVLHNSCHNPTGIDPSKEQWKEISSLIKKKKVIPFFDFAYQGFIGTVEEDAFPIRYFASEGHEMMVAHSFSKNMGMYGERVGAIFVITSHKESAHKVGSQIKQIIRSNYSNPPIHGARLAAGILLSDDLRSEWLLELATMRDRIKAMRLALISGLQTGGNGKDWSYLNRQNGFFSFCSLTQENVESLVKDYAIYLPSNGRINIAGLNERNIDYVVKAILNIINK